MTWSQRGARVPRSGGAMRGITRGLAIAGALTIAGLALTGCVAAPATPARSSADELTRLTAQAERRSVAGQWESALSAWAQVLRADPFAYRAHVERARCYYQLGEYGLEISEYRKALAINPSYPAALSRLGHALLGQDALEEARSVYWRYLTLVPEDPRVLFNLAQVEAKLGDLPASARLLERYREVSPPPD